jgi:hypothetical protein
MKNKLLMLMAICLLALPLKANDLVEELCADEVFISMLKECEKVTKHVQLLNADEVEVYLGSAEFVCFRENFIRNANYLSETFNIFNRTGGKVAISKAIKKLMTDPAECEFYFSIAYYNCYSIAPFPNVPCLEEAIRRYNICMGLPGEE